MAGQNPLLFIPFNKGADNRLGSRVSVRVRSWWQTKKGSDFGGFHLRTITKNNMFKLRDLDPACRHGSCGRVVMQGLFGLSPMAPCFCRTMFVTHFWRKDLMKNAELLFTF